MIVAKFGGTSMANAQQIRKVADITKGDEYSVVVVSAPGKRFKGDVKVTDLLYEFAKDSSAWTKVYDRLFEIEAELGIAHTASEHFKSNRDKYKTEDEIASRGEYYSAMIFAAFTGREFVDTAELVVINDNGSPNQKTYSNITAALSKSKRYSIPGFYGKGTSGQIKTFSRGGSDITGSIFARALNASKYENWTDVSGIYAADPNIITSAKKIDNITYKELLILGQSGAQVFHPLAVEPVADVIPLEIKNTNAPSQNGTLITTTRDMNINPVIAVTCKDDTLYVIGENKILYQQKIKQNKDKELLELYNKYITA